MSLVVTVYVPGGIVMAGDSRTMRSIKAKLGEEEVEQFIILSDNSYKVVALSKVPVGIAHTGTAIIDNQSVESHLMAFEEQRIQEGDTPHKVTKALSTYFQQEFPGVPVRFYVAGYEFTNGTNVPHVYTFHTTEETEPNRLNTDENGQVGYGIAQGGDGEIVNRLIVKKYLPAFAALPLQDAIDYAIYLIDLTIKTMRFEPKVPTVGGPIDVLLITPDGLGFVQRKQLHGEEPSRAWQPRPPTTSSVTQVETETKRRVRSKKK